MRLNMDTREEYFSPDVNSTNAHTAYIHKHTTHKNAKNIKELCKNEELNHETKSGKITRKIRMRMQTLIHSKSPNRLFSATLVFLIFCAVLFGPLLFHGDNVALLMFIV